MKKLLTLTLIFGLMLGLARIAGATCTDYATGGGAWPLTTTPVAGHTYCGDNHLYTLAGSITGSASNVQFSFPLGGGIQETTATDTLFNISGSHWGIFSATLDGDSLSNAGNLVSFTGVDLIVEDVTVQNFGTTNPALYSTGSDQFKVDRLQCVHAPGICEELVSSAGNITNFALTNSDLSTPTSGSGPASLFYLNVSTNLASGGLISGNTVSGQDTSGNTYLFYVAGQVGPDIDSVKMNLNHCFATGTLHACYRMFGAMNSQINNNSVKDGGNLIVQAIAGGDLFDSNVDANDFNLTGASAPIEVIDGERDSVSMNHVAGFNGGAGSNVAILVTDVGTECDAFAVIGNTVEFTSGVAGEAIQIWSEASGKPCSYNHVEGNVTFGTNSTGQIGLWITATGGSGSGVSNHVGPNVWYNLKTGIQVDTGMTGTAIDQQTMDTVATPYTLNVATTLLDLKTGMTLANIPSNLADGSQLFVTSTTQTSPCAAGSLDAIMRVENGADNCQSPNPPTVTFALNAPGNVITANLDGAWVTPFSGTIKGGATSFGVLSGCTGSGPIYTLEDCGSSASCASPTAIGTFTVGTTTNTVVTPSSLGSFTKGDIITYKFTTVNGCTAVTGYLSAWGQ